MSEENEKKEFEANLTQHQADLLEKLAVKLVQLRMTTPAILFLESVRPMNYVGSQIMVFLAPLVRTFFGLPEWDELRKILEHRESVGYFLDLIEEKEAELLLNEKSNPNEKKKTVSFKLFGSSKKMNSVNSISEKDK